MQMNQSCMAFVVFANGYLRRTGKAELTEIGQNPLPWAFVRHHYVEEKRGETVHSDCYMYDLLLFIYLFDEEKKEVPVVHSTPTCN